MNASQLSKVLPPHCVQQDSTAKLPTSRGKTQSSSVRPSECLVAPKARTYTSAVKPNTKAHHGQGFLGDAYTGSSSDPSKILERAGFELLRGLFHQTAPVTKHAYVSKPQASHVLPASLGSGRHTDWRQIAMPGRFSLLLASRRLC